MRRQRGIALITAVLIAALAAVAAAAVLGHTATMMRRAENLWESERAWWYAEGMSSWGRSILLRDAQQSQTDHLGEAWAQEVPALPVERGVLSGRIVDLQGRFNINLLGLPDSQRQPWLQRFRHLAECVGIDGYEAEQLAAAIADWIDADDQAGFPGGAEVLDYLNLRPPYRSADRPIHSISELAAVRGVTRKHYTALREHLAALPLGATAPPPRINPNTATPAVLCALAGGGNAPALEQFIEERVDKPLETVQDAIQRKLFPPDFDPAVLTVSSDYFEIQSQALIGTGRAALYSVVHRRAGGPPVTVWRRLDTD